MNFADLRGACEEFHATLRAATGRELIKAVSVEEPVEPKDELYFLKLVSWCYVFLFEASQPATRYTLSLLRVASPSEHRTISTILDDVNCLRTVRVHNLLPESRSDDYKQRRANIWLVKNGGDPHSWVSCCDSLCAAAIAVIRILKEKWSRLTANHEDSPAAVQDLLTTINQEWPPHLFDRIVEGVASEIGLQGFDYVKYRQHRLDRWRGLASFFENRQDAETAMRGAIHRELEQLFGHSTSRRRNPNLSEPPPQEISV